VSVKKGLLGAALCALLLVCACVTLFSGKPETVSFQERLGAFPVENLPLSAPATVYWDDHLIPFIEAQNDSDCAFLLGMVHSHLRLGQMTLMRRATRGQLAEIAGPLAVDIDRALRTLDLGFAADSIATLLPPSTRAWLEAFVAGINYYQRRCEKLPPEFAFLNMQPEPWTLRDLLLLGRLMGADVTWFSGLQWIKHQDKPWFAELYARFVRFGLHSEASFSPLTRVLSGGIKSGSNALVLSAAKSATGSALIASDPHLGLQLPNLWLIAGYKCPSYHVLGFMFPGVPMVLIGRNEHIAWAGTNMRSQSSDIYEINPRDSIDLQSRTERVKVRWWRDKEVPLRTSALGPILSDISMLGSRPGQTLALKWLGHAPSDEFSAFLRVNRAGEWTAFREAFAPYGVSGQNFLYADDAGSIGMVLAVRLPKRPSDYRPQIIHQAADSSARWGGVVSALELPYSFNPPQGFIASANNLPAVTHPAVGNFFSANDRINRLHAVVAGRARWQIADLQRLQQDVFSESARELAEQIVRCARDWQLDAAAESEASLYLGALGAWDGAYCIDAAAPVILQSILHHFIRLYYTERYDQEAAELILGAEQSHALVLEDLKREGEARLRRCLDEAIREAGPAVRKYANWGEMHRLRLAHPFGNIPVIGGAYRYGDYPAAGSYLTLHKTAHAITDERHASFYGANARFIADMADRDENYFVLLGGQDGWLGSDLVTDQVPLWLKGAYLKVPFQQPAVATRFRHQQKLPARPR